jgi:5-deoxy-glucuronate isomerase
MNDVSVEMRAAHIKRDGLTVADGEREHIIVILAGRCAARFDDDGPAWTDLGKRDDVFSGRATALYVPPHRRCFLTGDADVAIASAPAETARQPYVVTPDEITVEHRGTGTWAREVHNIIDPHHPADRLLVGETFHGPGVWSAFPPHRHDVDDPPRERRLAEAFLIRVSPPTGFGLLVRYPNAESPRQARVITDGEIVTVDGFHSFVSEAGHRFYYLWAIAGVERRLQFRVDPRDAWLLDEQTS